jgi:hypothetical protein
MQPRVRIGLIVGAISAVLNICVAGFVGICGPVLSLIAGGIAGYLAVQQEKSVTKNEGARVGATAGGIAGGLIILGQILGGIAALVFIQTSGTQLPFGQVPSTGDSTQIVYYGSGVVTAFCFGLVGAALAAGAGAGIGYLTTPDKPMTTPPSQDIIS